MKTLGLLQEWGWQNGLPNPQSAYIHVPFCAHRCGYCNFSLLANRSDLFARYLDALEAELQALEVPRPVTTLFLGGGTPSILPLKETEQMLRLLAFWLPQSGDAPEWSIEANPLDVTQEKLKLWASYGIRRISLGGQSFDPQKLKILERDHSPIQLQQAITLAQQFMNSVSLDLIFAAPGETLEVWRNDVETAIRCEVNHVSTYGLTYEKGARFWGLRSRNQLAVVTEDTELEMYALAIDTLTGTGFDHYEISNFAKPGHECRHNQTYWNGDAWWAFGPSAARYVGDVRSVNHRGTLTYLRRMEEGMSPVDERESLTASQKVRERFVFGMRQIGGVDWRRLSEQADQATRHSISDKISEHTHAGWMVVDAGRVKLTRQGLFLSDSLWHHYL